MGEGGEPKMIYDKELEGDYYCIIGSIGGKPEYEFDENNGHISVSVPTLIIMMGCYSVRRDTLWSVRFLVNGIY